MTALAIFQEMGSDFQSLAGSSITIRSLLALYHEGKTLERLQSEIGGASSSHYQMLQRLRNSGLIHEESGTYFLSNSGLFLAGKLLHFFDSYGIIKKQSVLLHLPQNDAQQNLLSIKKNQESIKWILKSGLVIQILLSLAKGPKTRRDLRLQTGSLSSSIRSRLRQMESYNLVAEEGYHYKLTPDGIAVCSALRELILTYAVVSRYGIFWNRYSLEGIPPVALDTVYELSNVEINQDGTGFSAIANFQKYLSILASGAFIRGISPFISKELTDTISQQAILGKSIDIIVTPDLGRLIFLNFFEGKVETLKLYPNVRFYVSDKPFKYALTLTDHCIVLKLILKDGKTYDHERIMTCGSPDVCIWAERFFQAFKKESILLQDYARKWLCAWSQ